MSYKEKKLSAKNKFITFIASMAFTVFMVPSSAFAAPVDDKMQPKEIVAHVSSEATAQNRNIGDDVDNTSVAPSTEVADTAENAAAQDASDAVAPAEATPSKAINHPATAATGKIQLPNVGGYEEEVEEVENPLTNGGIVEEAPAINWTLIAAIAAGVFLVAGFAVLLFGRKRRQN